MTRILFLIALALLLRPSVSSAQQTAATTRQPQPLAQLELSGDAALKNHLEKRRIAPQQRLTLRGQTDVMLLQQLFARLQTGTSPDTLVLDRLAITQLPLNTALLRVKAVQITQCEQLNLDAAVVLAAGQPNLQSFQLEVAHLTQFPASLQRLRHLSEIQIVNTDLALADGYALNHNLPGALYAEDSLVLGFNDAQRSASNLVVRYGCYNQAITEQHLLLLSDYLQGVSGVGAQLPQRAATQAFNYKHPLVKQPIAGVDVARNYYTLRAETGTSFSYPSGSRVLIPKNAFVTAAGQPVRGEVIVSYREFRDPTDIIVSGIPMRYDSAGVTGDFESAGMFELVASAAGQPVFLAPDKKVDMQFAVTDTASTYNFYRLDEQQGWQYLNKPGALLQPQAPTSPAAATLLSAAIRRFQQLLKQRRRIAIGDTTRFAERYSNNDYFYNTDISKYEQTPRFLRKHQYLKLRRVANGRQNTCIRLEQPKGQFFPELTSYSAIVWQMNERISAAEFRKRYGKAFAFTDIRVHQAGEGNYTLEIKHQQGFLRIPVKPMQYNNDQLSAVAATKMAGLDKRYNKQLNKREKYFDKKIERKIRRVKVWGKAVHADSVRAWNKSRDYMDGTEQTMTFTTWAQYLIAQQPQVQLSMDNFNWVGADEYKKATRALQLSGFGVFNCDQVQRQENPKLVKGIGRVLTGTVFPAIVAYVINKGKNMALLFGASGAGGSIPLSFSTTDSCSLLLIDKVGCVALVSSDELHRHTNAPDPEKCEFSISSFTDKPVSVAELRKLLR